MKPLNKDHEEQITKLADEPNGIIVPNGNSAGGLTQFQVLPYKAKLRRF